VSQFGYGTSPIAVSWLRSAGAGQKTSLIVRVFGAPELLLVEVLDELLEVVREVLDDVVEFERKTKAPAAMTIRMITTTATATRPIAYLRLGKNCKA
jgi:hypothetical protein